MSGADLQRQARALGDPTRHRLFRHVAESDRPVEVAELAELLGLHHNAIRQHLAKLVEAELVVPATVRRGGRGRPRLCYTVHPAADGRWGVTGAYERLSLLLTEIIRTGDSPIEVGRRAGRRWSAGATAGDGDPVTGFVDAMARHGFEPVATRRGERVDIVLGSCPFASTASADPDTVCGLHRGLVDGTAESFEGLVVDEMTPRDPHRALCRLRGHVTPTS